MVEVVPPMLTDVILTAIVVYENVEIHSTGFCIILRLITMNLIFGNTLRLSGFFMSSAF